MLSAVALVHSCLGLLCNVMDYGAVGNGVHDDTIAVGAAIAACGSAGDAPSLRFPADHVFRTGPFSINGSDTLLKSWTKSGSSLAIESNVTLLNAITQPSDWPVEAQALIQVSHVSDFSIVGANAGAFMVDANFINTSVVEGGGAPWWTLRRGNSSAFAPNLLTIESSQNVTVSGLTLQNSPMYHLVAEIRVHSVTGVNLTIEAPADSPNTHTVDLAGEHHLLEKCYLAGGDDNVAIHPNASSIVVRNVHCSHGHGTSIGSVGLDNSTGFVTDVLFSDITYTGTSNIARVKTWQGGLGAVRNVTYRNLQFSDTGYPITIDQFYCPSGISSSPCFNSTRAVQLSDLTFENFHGTQNSGHAGEIHCADSSPCDNLVLRNITILPSGSKQGEWSCWQVVNSTDASTQPPLATAGNCHWN